MVVDDTRFISSAKKVRLEDIVWFGKAPAPKLRNGSMEWFKYRYGIFGDKVLDIMKDLYPEEMVASEEKECTYDNKKIWQFPKWYLTFKGLYLGSKDIMHSKCNDAPWSVIPWEQLTAYWVKE